MSAFTAKRTTFHHKRVINNALGTYSNVSTLELLRLRLLGFHWLWWRSHCLRFCWLRRGYLRFGLWHAWLWLDWLRLSGLLLRYCVLLGAQGLLV